MTEPTLVILAGLEGNAPTRLTETQLALLPYADLLKFSWALVFVSVVMYLLVSKIMLPVLRRAMMSSRS